MATISCRRIACFNPTILVSKMSTGAATSEAAKPAANKPEDKKPLWYILPGMGTQWSGMGKDLMKIDAFQESVQRSTATLKNAGVDLNALLAPTNKSIFANIRDAFNSITVMQIAIYDTLTAAGMGPRPKGVFGHSAGEILCAYVDGCITAEETILIADARGRAMVETQDKNNPGTMAAVIRGWSEVKSKCPPGVTLACNNGPKSVTISGSKRVVTDFIHKLKRQKIMAVEVNSCGIAAHSPHIEPAKDVYLKYMNEIFGENKTRERNSRWIPTSYDKKDWNSPESKVISPEFFAHNLMRPVLFHEVMVTIPKDAVVVEIAPKGLFQGILKSCVAPTVKCFAPMSDEESNKVKYFVKTIEDIGRAGIHVDSNVVAGWKKL